MDSIKVLIGDDHPVFRTGLRQILDSEPDMEVIGEAENGQDILECVRKLRPEVLLLDIAMPGISGLEASEMVRQQFPGTQVVILSIYNKEAYIRQALKSGALGYVLKGSPSSEIPKAIRSAHRGKYFLTSRVNANLIDAYLRRKSGGGVEEAYEQLSDREQQVFRLMVEGNSTKKIAETLSISTKTVEKHRVNVMKKLEIYDLLGLAKYALRIGVLEPEYWQQ